MEREIYLAGGCFWGLQQYFECVHGVTQTQAGYANGSTPDPTYQEVCTGKTGYAETVKVVYDDGIIPLSGVLELYLDAIDPTVRNRQGNDIGSQYRTGIYYVKEQDLPVIRQSIEREQKKHTRPIVTEVRPLRSYYAAEEYHQNYLQKNPGGYCHIGREAFINAGKYSV